MKAALLLAVCCALCAQKLHPGKTAGGEISGGDSRIFTIQLKSGEFARVMVWQPRFPTILRLRGPDGAPLTELNLPGAAQKAEPLVLIAERAGEYRLELTAGRVDDRDRYRIELDRPRAAVPADLRSIAAQKASNAARGSESKRDYTHAIEEWEKALTLYREAKDREREAAALNAIGAGNNSLGRSDLALEYYEKSLPIFREIRDRRGEGEALNGLGEACHRTGEGEKALQYFQNGLQVFRGIGDQRGQAESLNGMGNATVGRQPALALRYFEQSLALRRITHDRLGEARALGNIGTQYMGTGQYEKAAEQYERVRTIAVELNDRRVEGLALDGLGVAYNSLAKWDQAAERYEQALAIFREIKNRTFEGKELIGLGLLYLNWSQFEKAIDYDQQALAIVRETKSRDDEGWILNNLGLIYSILGRHEEGVRYYEQALPIAREVQDGDLECELLSSLAGEYGRLKQYQKSSLYYEQALSLSRKIKDKRQEAIALGGLADLYCAQGDCGRAIQYLQQALALSRETGDRLRGGLSLNQLGVTYEKMADLAAAAASYEQALATFRGIKDPGLEGRSLEGLMDVEKARNQPRLAIFYGKQSVNALQSVRANIRGLDKDLQRGYARNNEQRYHTLAELLISQGRLDEAEQVLALLKEEEYFEFVRREAGEGSTLDRRADLTPVESEWDKRYREIGGRLMAIGSERGELLAKKSRTAEETRRLTQLEQDLTAGNHAFEKFLGELSRNFNAKPERVEQIRETQGIMEDLRELPPGTVAIYTLAGENRFRAILRSADAEKAYEYPISATDLNRKVMEFRAAVQNPQSDPRPLARELYQILVAGMADDLRQARAKTLMWSLDGVLRYLPVAALYDGSRYLIEDYGISVMTLASNSRLKDRPDRVWTAAEFGVTKAFGDNPALPAVAGELNGIAAILHGDVKLDDQFTSDTMRQTLLDRHPVVHIASHFRFQAGDQSRSYLLLGDGSHLSLADLKNMPNLFGGVQLLTLSACNTGVGDGTEVEGFGTLAQRQGAKAVIASLWPVADASTSRLMQAFYRIRESSPSMTKLEALREAQLKFLPGEEEPAPEAQGDRGVAIARPAGVAGYAHPYYWAPFFLMGNWL